MAAALFPMLREVDIHSNPLTTRRSGKASLFWYKRPFLKLGSELSVQKLPSCLCLNAGDPPLLTYYLQERLGITIKRKKTQEAVKKLPLKVSTDPKWKVGCVLHCCCPIMTLQISLYVSKTVTLLIFLYCRWKKESWRRQRSHCWWMRLILLRLRKVRWLSREHQNPSMKTQSSSLLLRYVHVPPLCWEK